MPNYRVHEEPPQPYIAAAGITKNRFVAHSATDGQAQHAGAGAANVIGVSKSTVISGEVVEVVTAGETLLEVDGSGTAIVKGDPLKSDANGKGVKAGANEKAHAAALEPATTATALISVKLDRHDG